MKTKNYLIKIFKFGNINISNDQAHPNNHSIHHPNRKVI